MTEIEKLNTGAPDITKERMENEKKIRNEVESDFTTLTPEAREAIIQSRLKILDNPGRPKLIRVDLGENASRKSKDDLFE